MGKYVTKYTLVILERIYNHFSFIHVSGSLTSVLQVFLGYQAGQIILTFKGHKERMLRFLVWSILNAIIGIALCGASKEDGLIPINKNLWYVHAV